MQAWFSWGRAHVAVLETSAEFKDLGDSSGERWEAEAGHDAWSELHAALVELGLEEWSAYSADDGMYFEEFNNLLGVFSASMQEATKLKDEYASECVDNAAQQLQESVAKVASMQGGHG